MKARKELFDNAWNGLKAQGFRRSVRRVTAKDLRGPDCLYRKPNGFKCAIGFSIPDSEYSPNMEGRGVHSLLVRSAADIAMTDTEFAHDLQVCHDYSTTPKVMESKLREFAQAHNLTIPNS